MPATDIPWALEQVVLRAPKYTLYRNYYLGQQRLAFASTKFRNAFGDLFREFADNLCRPVVDTFVDRLQLEGFEGGSDAETQAARDLWAANRMGARAGQVHLNSSREGDAFLMVWPDLTGFPRMWPQVPDHMAVRYSDDNPDLIDLAAKVWRKGKRWRCTLYYPDHLERYETAGAAPGGGVPQARAFRPMEAREREDGTTEEAEVPNEWGMVPLFHFPNGTVGDYGMSDLTDVVPIQDALNKAVADMLVTMEFHAYPQRWATGLEVRYKDDGTEVAPLDPGADRLWHVPSEATRFGQFDAANLEQFLKVQDAFRVEAARITGTPLHALALVSSGQPPSGESLKVSEGRLVKRAQDRHRDWGETWEAALSLALRMQGAGEDIELEAVWAEAESRISEKEAAETQEIKQRLGVSKEQSLLELGYDPEKVQEMLDEANGQAADLALVEGAVGGGRPVPTAVEAALLAGTTAGTTFAGGPDGTA